MTRKSKKAFIAKDFSLATNKANASEITLNARYPEVGKAVNIKSEMLVYILKGNVAFTQNGKSKKFSRGDMILVKMKEPYFWMPVKSVTLLIISAPPWTPKQQRIVV